MNNYIIIISFDGTKHDGFQRLKGNDNTIQGIIENSLSSLLSENIRITGCGRTDSGVSAHRYTANFLCSRSIYSREADAVGFVADINKLLPASVRVLSIAKANRSFHARHSCLYKTYRYTIDLINKPDVFNRHHSYYPIDAPIQASFEGYSVSSYDFDAMYSAAALLMGTHDFTAFTSDKRSDRDNTRTILSITFDITDAHLHIYITGDGFLYNMVRIISGTLIQVGLGTLSCDSIKQALLKHDRRLSGVTLPPQGLSLISCVYPED